MANFILIHGAMHGGWCWERVVPLLEQQGHKVIAPDLPGMGETRLPPAEVTLEAWSRFTVDLLNRQPGRSILVGHSLGGMVISQAAEAAPGRIAMLVYATALLPRNGLSAFDLTRGEDVPERDARIDLSPTDDGQCITAEPTAARAFMYGETAAEWAELAVSRLQPQPMEPLRTPAVLTEVNFGAVPRTYIECLRDRIIPLAVQRAMHTASPCATVRAIDTDHSPFYSTPESLTAHLLQSAAAFNAQ
jgi:pimeloyl-ACP methyl ester carboxylesterase